MKTRKRIVGEMCALAIIAMTLIGCDDQRPIASQGDVPPERSVAFDASMSSGDVCLTGDILAAGFGTGEISILDYPALRELQKIRMPNARIVTSVAFSADGKLLAACQDTEVVHVFDVTTGKAIREIEDPQGLSVSAADFSPDGTRLCICARGSERDGVLRVLSTASWSQLAQWTNPNHRNDTESTFSVKSARFSSDNSLIIAWTWDGVALLSATDLSVVEYFRGGSPCPPAIDHSNRFVAFEREGIRLCDREAKQPPLKINTEVSDAPIALLFSPDNKYLIVGYGEVLRRPGTIEIFSLESKDVKKVASFNSPGLGRITVMMMSRDGHILAGDLDHRLYDWKCDTMVTHSTSSRLRHVNR